MPQREQQKEGLRGQESERQRIYARERRTTHKAKALQLQQHQNIATNQNFQPFFMQKKQKTKGYNTIHKE